MASDSVVRCFTFLGAITSPATKYKGEVGDGREKALLKHVLHKAEEGSPESVLTTVDDYCKRTWLMCIGDEKGALLDSCVRDRNPRVALELGAYCGYSAVRIASQMKDPSSLLVTLEMNAANVDTARRLVDHAGLSSKVQVVEGILKESLDELKRLLRSSDATNFDFVFIDHDKDAYLPDFLLLKEHGFIGQGTVIVADNMRFPGSPKYRRYLKKHPEELETVEHKCGFEYIPWLPDSLMVSTCKKLASPLSTDIQEFATVGKGPTKRSVVPYRFQASLQAQPGLSVVQSRIQGA